MHTRRGGQREREKERKEGRERKGGREEGREGGRERERDLKLGPPTQFITMVLQTPVLIERHRKTRTAPRF